MSEGESENRGVHTTPELAILLLLVVLEATYDYRFLASTDSDSTTGSDICDYHCLFLEMFKKIITFSYEIRLR